VPVLFSPRFCHDLVQCLEEEGGADHRLCGPRLFGQMFTERRTADRKSGGPRYLPRWSSTTHQSCVWTGWIELPTRACPFGTSQTPQSGVCASPPCYQLSNFGSSRAPCQTCRISTL
jgi:hypothetical protein